MDGLHFFPTVVVELAIQIRPSERLPAEGHRLGRSSGAIEEPKFGRRRLPPGSRRGFALELRVPLPSLLELAQVALGRLKTELNTRVLGKHRSERGQLI